jgi:hypothetical protein
MANRQRLLWAIATRRQLERWERYVARDVRLSLANGGREGLESAEIWLASIEHHFTLIAARNLIRALELDAPTSVVLDPDMASELIGGRDLHEHWVENMPIFNVTPRQRQPKHPSGNAFAARNGNDSPYWWLGWGNTTGAVLLPNVTASKLHDLLDIVEADVLSRQPELAAYVPERAQSPWIEEEVDKGEWWPLSEVPIAFLERTWRVHWRAAPPRPMVEPSRRCLQTAEAA